MASLQLQPSFVRVKLMTHLFRLDLEPLVLRRQLMPALIAVQFRFLLKIRQRILLAVHVLVATGFPFASAVLVANKSAPKEEMERNDTKRNDDADDDLDFGWKTSRGHGRQTWRVGPETV